MPIKDRICSRINGWLGKNLSWVGREVLVKAVAQAIPTYAMNVFKLPSEFNHRIQASIINYWWGHDDCKIKIHWVSKSKLLRSKLVGSLGFRDLEAFNLALLAHQVWRLLNAEHSLAYKLSK